MLLRHLECSSNVRINLDFLKIHKSLFEIFSRYQITQLMFFNIISENVILKSIKSLIMPISLTESKSKLISKQMKRRISPQAQNPHCNELDFVWCAGISCFEIPFVPLIKLPKQLYNSSELIVMEMPKLRLVKAINFEWVNNLLSLQSSPLLGINLMRIFFLCLINKTSFLVWFMVASKIKSRSFWQPFVR